MSLFSGSMKRLLFLLFLAAATAHAQSDAQPAPALPIKSSKYRGFTNSIVLQNEIVRVVIVPEIGRITEFALRDSENILRADAMLDRGKSSDTNNWANYGGSWLWPAAQNRWEEIFGRNWPPPYFDALNWTSAAWRREDGAQFCRLQLSIGEPLHTRYTREFLLSKKSPRLFIRQHADRILAGKMPVTLWNIVQIANTDEVVLPVEPGAGLIPLYDKPVAREHLTTCDGTVVLAPAGIDETKIGSASPRSWIAARRGNLVVILRATPADAGTFPDQNSRVTLFTSRGLGYSEIESNSEERNLAPGESLANTVTLELYRAPARLTGCELATWVRQLIGEIPFPKEDETAARPAKLL